MHLPKNNRGFGIAEILFVIVSIGIISLVGYYAFQRQNNKNTDTVAPVSEPAPDETQDPQPPNTDYIPSNYNQRDAEEYKQYLADLELIGDYGPENKVTVLFEPDSPELVDTDWESDLTIISELLQRFPTLTAVVEGHAADVVSEVDGEKLSEERAIVVSDILQDLGVAKEQVDIDVRAFEFAVGDNETEDGRALNRRAFVYIVFLF